MQERDRFRERLAACGADIPPDLVDIVLLAAGPMVTSLDALVALDLADVEPFIPARRLPLDAPPR